MLVTEDRWGDVTRLTTGSPLDGSISATAGDGGFDILEPSGSTPLAGATVEAEDTINVE